MNGELVIINEYMDKDASGIARTYVDLQCKSCDKIIKRRLKTIYRNYNICMDCQDKSNRQFPGRKIILTKNHPKIKEVIGKEINSVKVIDKVHENGEAHVVLKCKCGYVYKMRYAKFIEMKETTKRVCKHCSEIIKSKDNIQYYKAMATLKYFKKNGVYIDKDFDEHETSSLYIAFMNYKEFLQSLGYDRDIHIIRRKDFTKGMTKDNIYLKDKKKIK